MDEPRPDLFPPDVQKRLAEIKAIAWHTQDFKSWPRSLRIIHLQRAHDVRSVFGSYRRHFSDHAEHVNKKGERA